MIRLETKLKYDINRETAKISALSSNKICKYNINISLVKKYYHLIKNK